MENRLAELRHEAGMTLKELGGRVGLSDAALSQYETGRRSPNLSVWKKLADFFDVSLSYILKESDVRHIYSLKSEEELFHDLQTKKVNIKDLSESEITILGIWIVSHENLFKDGQKFASSAKLAHMIVQYARQIIFERTTFPPDDDADGEEIEKAIREYNGIGPNPKQILEFIEKGKKHSAEEIQAFLDRF